MAMKKPTAGVILAAGMSTRFNRPKQLIKWSGKCLIEHVMDNAAGSNLEKVVLVLGHCFDDILQEINLNPKNPKIEIVENPRYKDGMSTSLTTGLSRVKDRYPSVMFLLGDQPMINTALINELLQGYWESEKDIGVPVCRGKQGNPVLFSRTFYDALMKISGDAGGRHIMDAHPDSVWTLEVDQPICFFDIDTEKDFNLFKNIIKTNC
jgi:molybdenum cofactor cytidylyltransferase